MTFLVRAASGEAKALVPTLRATIHDMNKGQPIGQVRFLDDVWATSMARERFVMVLMIFLGVVGLILVISGVYSMASYAVVRRRREIGVRIALGSGSAGVFRLIMWNTLNPALVGLLVGLGAALFASRLFTSLLYGIPPTDPFTVVVTCLVILLVAIAGSALPAWSATKVDPAVGMRSQ